MARENISQKPDISLDGSGIFTANDYQPLWLCDPAKNIGCAKEGCQIHCWHTTDIACARTSGAADQVLMPPIYPFAELKDQSIRERQHRELVRAVCTGSYDWAAEELRKARIIADGKQADNKQVGGNVSRGLVWTILLLAGFGLAILIWTWVKLLV